MKNILIVDIDTEREKQVMFGKGKDFVMPEENDDAAHETVLLTDIQTLVDGLNHLIIYTGRDDLREEIAKFISEGGKVQGENTEGEISPEETV